MKFNLQKECLANGCWHLALHLEKLACCAVVVVVVLAALLCSDRAVAAETSSERDARMQWWRDAKFGMMIHWGVYSVPAGVYHGEKVPGIGEWIMLNAKIPVAEYRGFAREFNPTNYHPDAWAALAKEAGMKYIVITAKHHDGFALFPSDVSEWDVADATPYKKDLITPLAEVARRNGLSFGTYYSQAQDWNNPGGAKAHGYQEGGGWDDAQKGSFDEYLAKVAVPQVREILTRIKPDILWWDTPEWMTEERARPLHDLIALRPGLITNNRLGGGYKGDTDSPEQFIPATGYKDRDWEACMTMNDTWGFKSDDQNWKPTGVLIYNLVDSVSKGGNYLLNIGPMADGQIPAASVQRLKEIGAWMKVNSVAIYGTTASPFAKLTWGRCTKKVTSQGGTLYLHVFHCPADGKLVLPGLRSKVTKARLLATGEKIGTAVEGGNVILSLPANAPDAIDSVIEVKFTGPLEVERVLPSPAADGRLVLGAELADIHNTLWAHAKLEGYGPDSKITDWNNSESCLSWDFTATKAGTFTVKADITGVGGGKLALTLEENQVPVEVPAVETATARTVELGRISIPKPGNYTLELKPDKNNWKGFDLTRLTLAPVQ